MAWEELLHSMLKAARLLRLDITEKDIPEYEDFKALVALDKRLWYLVKKGGNHQMQATNEQHREQFNRAFIEAIRPEKTGQFCFDVFMWDEHKPILRLLGDHGTPDFTLTFLEGEKVLVSPDSNTSWAKVVETTFTDYDKLAQDVLATMLVIALVGSL